MGRPLKINEQFIQATKEVLQDDINSLLLDEDLLFLINDKLPEEDRIHENTFSNYINKPQNNDTLKEFLCLIKKARVFQKKNLIKEVKQKDRNWQAIAWILERKFSNEYNLKQETHLTADPITININLNKDGSK